MSNIEVDVTVTIKDSLGRELISITKTEDKFVTDNPRYWSTYTRGVIQSTEHAIAAMLVSQYGEVPK